MKVSVCARSCGSRLSAHLQQSRQPEGWRVLRKCGSGGGRATTTAPPQASAGSLARSTLARSTLARSTLARPTLARSTLARSTLARVQACSAHACSSRPRGSAWSTLSSVHAQLVHARSVHAQLVHARSVHARPAHARKAGHPPPSEPQLSFPVTDRLFELFEFLPQALWVSTRFSIIINPRTYIKQRFRPRFSSPSTSIWRPPRQRERGLVVGRDRAKAHCMPPSQSRSAASGTS